MRVLYAANATWANTGYGVQGRYLLPGLRALGHEVAQFAWYGLQGGMFQLADGTPVYPGAYDGYGNDVVSAHAQHFGADLIISLIDLWVCDPVEWTGSEAKWLAWFPNDHAPPAPRIVEIAQQVHYPTCYSVWGQTQMAAAGVPCAYVPHGCNTDIFTPGDRAAARRYLGWPEDGFIALMVAANKGNPSRKAFPEQLEAFARFRATHPAARLHLHTIPDGGGLGLNLPVLVEALGLTDCVGYSKPYQQLLGISERNMAELYRAADVLLSATHGEGFCYTAGMKVATSTGFTPIEQLTTQDWVVTHEGRLRDITQTMRRWVVDEPFVTLRACGNTQPIALTANHPVLAVRRQWRTFTSVRRAIRRGEVKPEWMSAGSLKVGDFLVAPQRQWAPVRASRVDLGAFTTVNGDYLTTKYSNRGARGVTARQVAIVAGVSSSTAHRVLSSYDQTYVSAALQSRVTDAAEAVHWQAAPQVSRYLPLTEDAGFLFGQYLAEGSIGTNGQIEYASHIREHAIRAKLCRVAGDLWGLTAKVYTRRHAQAASTVFTSRGLATAIGATCGRGAHHKHLPPFTFDNPEFARGLLIGAWLGDGYFGAVASYATASPQLAYGMVQLLSALGFRGSLQEDGRGAWVVSVAGKQLGAFLTLFGKADRVKRAAERVLSVSGQWWTPLTRVERSRYTGEVYNLEVAGDHSYCVEGIATHNCIPLIEAQACGTPVLSSAFSAMPELTVNGISVQPAQRCWSEWGDGLHAWQVVPSIDGITEALREIAARPPAVTAAESARGAAFVQEHYAWPRVFAEHWAPLLARVEQDRADERAALRGALVHAAAAAPMQAYRLRYEAYAERDHARPRSEADAWYNAHRFRVACTLLPGAHLPASPVAVDLGCAEGAFITAALSRGIGTPEGWCGVDLIPRRLERARAGAPHIAWAEGDITTWGADATYDLVVCLETIEHVLDPAALLANIERILKPGGWLLLSTPNDPSGSMVDGEEHLRGYDRAALQAALDHTGLIPTCWGATMPGLYGPAGLLAHPERLVQYRARDNATHWLPSDGSNLYVLAQHSPVPLATGPAVAEPTDSVLA